MSESDGDELSEPSETKANDEEEEEDMISDSAEFSEYGSDPDEANMSTTASGAFVSWTDADVTGLLGENSL